MMPNKEIQGAKEVAPLLEHTVVRIAIAMFTNMMTCMIISVR